MYSFMIPSTLITAKEKLNILVFAAFSSASCLFLCATALKLYSNTVFKTTYIIVAIAPLFTQDFFFFLHRIPNLKHHTRIASVMFQHQ